MQLNWLDFAIIIVVALSVVEGIARGFARIGIGLGAAILGIILGIWFYGAVGLFFLPYVSSRSVSNLIGFALVFLGCVIAGAIVGKGLAWLFKWAGLSWVDRGLGAVFGFLRGLVGAVALVLVIVAFTPKPPPQSVATSHYAPYLIGAANVCAELAPRELKDSFFASYYQLKELWNKAVPHEAARLPEAEI